MGAVPRAAEGRWRDILPLVSALKFLLSWGESKAESRGDLGRAGSQWAFGMPGGYIVVLDPEGQVRRAGSAVCSRPEAGGS